MASETTDAKVEKMTEEELMRRRGEVYEQVGDG
jgi:hypothetical protein